MADPPRGRVARRRAARRHRDVRRASSSSKLEQLIAFRKLLQVVERRGPTRDVIIGAARARRAATRRSSPTASGSRRFADALNTPTRTVDACSPTKNTRRSRSSIEDRTGGYPRHHRIDLDFVTTGEFRTLAASYQDVKDITGPMVVKTTGAGARGRRCGADEAGARPRRRHRDRRRAIDEATRLAAEPKPPRLGRSGSRRRRPRADVRVESLDELVEYFIAAGKKGIAVNRYKGLGEMNPDTLWETTMDPDEADAAAGARRRSHGSGPDVHDADGRSGRAAPQVHRRQRARREEPRHLIGLGG